MSIFSLPLDDEDKDEQQPPNTKLLNVSITILSISGVHARETSKKTSYRSKFTRKSSQSQQQLHEDETSDFGSLATANTGDQQVRSSPTTTVVASFERVSDEDANKTIMTHVPSLPLSLPPPSSSSSTTTAARTFDDVVYWPEQDEETHSKLSSFTFQRYFPREDPHAAYGDTTSNPVSSRYVPQLCPIQVSISRNNNGKMYKLGSAHVFVSGEENGESSMNVPVVNFETAFKVMNTSTRRGRGSSGNVSMMRLKGDTLKCGLAERATLRVLVRVSDPVSLSGFLRTPRIQLKQVNYALPSLEKKKEKSKKNDKKADISTLRHSTSSVCTSSEASWEYDPDQMAVVLKRHSTSSVCTSSEASWEYDPDQMAVVLKKKNNLLISKDRDHRDGAATIRKEVFNRVTSHMNQDYNNDEQSHTTATASTNDGHSSEASSYDAITTSSSSSSHHSNQSSRFSYIDDDHSLYSETSEEELLRIINDISKNRSHNDDTTVTRHCTQQVMNDDQRRRPWDDTTTVTSCSTSTGTSSIATPPTSPRLTSSSAAAEHTLLFPRNVYYCKNKKATTTSMLSNWGRRFVCCGSPNTTAGFTRSDEELLLASINEDSVTSSYSGDRYSLKGREHSLQTVESNQSPW